MTTTNGELTLALSMLNARKARIPRLVVRWQIALIVVPTLAFGAFQIAVVMLVWFGWPGGKWLFFSKEFGFAGFAMFAAIPASLLVGVLLVKWYFCGLRRRVAGVFAGSTNAPVHAYGMLVEMMLVNGSGMAAFVPTGVAADAADAQAGANGFLAHFRPQAALAAGLAGAVYLEADPYGCSAEQRLCYGRAHFNLKACAYGVTAGTVLCIGAAAYLCAASGPGYVFCFAAGSAICLIAEVLALVVCANLYEAALLGCDSARLACEAANAPAIEPE